MSLRADLQDFLSQLPNVDSPATRKALIHSIGFSHLAQRIDWDGSNLEFATHLLDVFGAEGSQELGRFLTALAGAPQVDALRRQQLTDVTRQLQRLTPDEFAAEFPALPPSPPTVSPPLLAIIGLLVVAILVLALWGPMREIICRPNPDGVVAAALQPFCPEAPAAVPGVTVNGSPTAPETMTGDFKIAVAEFGRLDGATPESDARAGEIADELFVVLGDAMSTTAPISVTIWPPVWTGMVEGESETGRAEFAEDLAQRIGADIVIFGNLRYQNGETALDPHFYVSATQLPWGEEAAGDYALGVSTVAGDVRENLVAMQELRSQILARAKAIAELASGLGYMRREEYAAAAAHLAAAADAHKWQDAKGLEIALLFLGTLAALEEDYALADHYYEQALAADPGFARAQLGRAQVLFLRARRNSCAPEETDGELLYQALQAYEKVPDLVAPPLAEIPAKLDLHIGRVYLCMAMAGLGDTWDKAQQRLEKVTAASAGRTGRERERIRYLAADAWNALGILHYTRAGQAENDGELLQAALAAFQQAADIGDRPGVQAIAYLWQALTYLKLEACTLAQEQLDAADRAYALFRQRNPTFQDQFYPEFRRQVGIAFVDQCGDPLPSPQGNTPANRQNAKVALVALFSQMTGWGSPQ